MDRGKREACTLREAVFHKLILGGLERVCHVGVMLTIVKRLR